MWTRMLTGTFWNNESFKLTIISAHLRTNEQCDQEFRRKRRQHFGENRQNIYIKASIFGAFWKSPKWWQIATSGHTTNENQFFWDTFFVLEKVLSPLEISLNFLILLYIWHDENSSMIVLASFADMVNNTYVVGAINHKLSNKKRQCQLQQQQNKRSKQWDRTLEGSIWHYQA